MRHSYIEVAKTFLCINPCIQQIKPHVENTYWHSRSASANPPDLAGPRRPTMRLRPLQDRVLIRRVEPEAMTSCGIFIPDTAQEKPTEGEVVAVGPGLRNEAGELHSPNVKVRDRVLFGKWSGTEMKQNGEDLMIMKEADLLAVIDRSVADQKAA